MLHKALFTTAKTKEAKTPMLKYLTIQINARNTPSEHVLSLQSERRKSAGNIDKSFYFPWQGAALPWLLIGNKQG